MRKFRREAGPIAWEALNGPQRKAFQWFAAWLSSAVGMLDEGGTRGREGSHPRELSVRQSRLLFLSGSRGAGKTSVLLSIMDACEAIRHGRQPPRSTRVGSQPGEQDDVGRAMENLQYAAPNLVWLETVDMERLPPSSNLLASLLSRLEDALQQSPGSQASNQSRLGVLGQDGDDVLQELSKLQHDVALAWDGHEPQRALALDPDAYAVEVTRAETARLRLNSRMSRVFDGIARLFGRQDPARTLFVLPIDDFDSNPLRVLELLRLLRLITQPRLLVIVLGNDRVTHDIIRMHTIGELVKVAAGSNGHLLRDLEEEIGRFAGEFSADVMRKQLPPAQRYDLKRLEPHESLQVDIPRQYERCNHGPHKLTDLLHGLPASEGHLAETEILGKAVNTIAARFRYKYPSLTKEASDSISSQSASSEYHYGGVFYLRASNREIQDLGAQICEVVHGNGKTVSLENTRIFVQKLAQDAIDQDPYMTPFHRRQLREAVRLIVRFEWQYGEWPVHFKYEQGNSVGVLGTPTHLMFVQDWNWLSAIEYPQDVTRAPGSSIEAPTKGASADGSEQDPGTRGRAGAPGTSDTADHERAIARTPASSRTIAILTVLRDSIAPQWRAARPHIDDRARLAWARWERAPGRHVDVFWPALPVPSFFEYSIFLSLWQQAARRIGMGEQGRAHAEYLAWLFLWMPVALTGIPHKKEVDAEKETDKANPPDDLAGWGEVLKADPASPSACKNRWAALNKAAKEAYASHQKDALTGVRLRDSAIAAALLVAPECGAPAPVARVVCSSQTMLEQWGSPDTALTIRRERARVVAKFDAIGDRNFGLALVTPCRMLSHLFNSKSKSIKIDELVGFLLCWLTDSVQEESPRVNPWGCRPREQAPDLWSARIRALEATINRKYISSIDRDGSRSRLIKYLVLSLTHPLNTCLSLRGATREEGDLWVARDTAALLNAIIKDPVGFSSDLCPSRYELGAMWSMQPLDAGRMAALR